MDHDDEPRIWSPVMSRVGPGAQRCRGPAPIDDDVETASSAMSRVVTTEHEHGSSSRMRDRGSWGM
jgi:hypothetical protein